MINRKIVLDVETTGLYPQYGDRVLEVAAIELYDNKDIGETFHYYVNPQRDISEDSTKIHGITVEKVKDSPVFSAIAEELVNFIGTSKIVAHNSEFDRSFINAELSLLNKNIYPKESFIDSLLLAKSKLDIQKASLDELCKRFEISLETRKDYHGALIDVMLLAKVYHCLTKGQVDIFETNTSSSKAILNNGVNVNKIDFPYREFKLEEDQEQAHIKFLESIKNPLWLKKI